MTDREKQIEEMAMSIAECNGTTCDNCRLKCNKYVTCEILYDKGYRKIDEVTLKLDLGDRSAEEIKQIAEAFNGDIKKQVAKEIINAISNEAGVLRQTFNPERASVLEMLVLQLKKEFEVE